jgi:hypothetical protein
VTSDDDRRTAAIIAICVAIAVLIALSLSG